MRWQNRTAALGATLTACAMLSACSPRAGAAQEVIPVAAAQTPAPPQAALPDFIQSRPDDTQFSDVLAEYQALNQRLSRVAAPLRLANAALCPRTFRDPGFVTHRLDDYPQNLRSVAEALLGLRETGVFIRTVRKGSPAEEADIEPGDQILKINGQPIPSGATQARFYEALSKNAFGGVQTRLTLRPQNGPDYETKLRAQTACDIPANVIFSETVNGHTDGREVLVTSALMFEVGDDNNLALITAHEMAHSIAGHFGQEPSRELELEADRMALVLMANAGYDIDAAIAYWERAPHPAPETQSRSLTHPSLAQRLRNFQAERRRINDLQKKSKPLTFE